MISINSNNKFSVISIEKWEDYQSEELKGNNKETTEEQQSNTNKKVKNIYLLLFNKYKAKIEKTEKKEFSKRISILNQLKEENDYIELLTIEEQDDLFNELIMS